VRRAIELILIAAAIAARIGLMAYARGQKHHRGDEVGSHGTKVVVVHVVP
jgi:hypothetical protein